VVLTSGSTVRSVGRLGGGNEHGIGTVQVGELPKALGCSDWYTARVTTLGELDEAMKFARASKTGAYIEIIGGKMDMPPALAYALGRLKAMYSGTP
jgi:TPP-dependent 2-oxoacid decarboxylase